MIRVPNWRKGIPSYCLFNTILYHNRLHHLHLLSLFLLLARSSFSYLLCSILLYLDPSVVNKMKENEERFNQQQQYYLKVKEEYDRWQLSNQPSFTNSSIPLPDLGSYPKAFPSPNQNSFVVRSPVLNIFYELEQQKEGNTRIGVPGYYIRGPWGVGKSVGMYFLASLAISKGWAVVYIPRCDEWGSKSEVNRSRYFIEEMAK